MSKTLLITFACFLLASCSQGENKILRQSSRNEIVDISDDLKKVNTPDSVMISNSNDFYDIGDYLAVVDYRSIDNLVYFFEAKSLSFINSAIRFGDGPSEISNIGELVWLSNDNKILAFNNNKYEIYKYGLDSLLHCEDWKAEEVLPMDKARFPTELEMVNDEEGMAVMLKPEGTSKFNLVLARYNYRTGSCEEFEFHPEIKRQRITIAASAEKDLCVSAYRRQDLMILTDLHGNLIKEIEGPLWGKENRKELAAFGPTVITRKHIVASFSGKGYYDDDYLPEQLVVFSLDGKYEKTLDVRHPIISICYDEQLGRIFLSLDDDPQFVYYDFNE